MLQHRGPVLVLQGRVGDVCVCLHQFGLHVCVFFREREGEREYISSACMCVCVCVCVCVCTVARPRWRHVLCAVSGCAQANDVAR